MAFPSTEVSTNNLDSASDDPSLARADLLDAVQKLNTIISEGGSAGGVALLNSSGKVPSSQMPANINTTGTLTLNPSNSIVAINSIMRLEPLTTTAVSNIAAPSTGDMVMTTDGDSGEPCPAVYDGVQWRRIELLNPISSDSTIPPIHSPGG